VSVSSDLAGRLRSSRALRALQIGAEMAPLGRRRGVPRFILLRRCTRRGSTTWRSHDHGHRPDVGVECVTIANQSTVKERARSGRCSEATACTLRPKQAPCHHARRIRGSGSSPAWRWDDSSVVCAPPSTLTLLAAFDGMGGALAVPLLLESSTCDRLVFDWVDLRKVLSGS
jgi:hypothetical protein